MTCHGNPTLLIAGGATAAQFVVVTDAAGRAVWRSHPLAAGRDAVRVDVRDGDFRGPGAGWSVLPPGRYAAAGAGGPFEVTAQRTITARFGADLDPWLPHEAARSLRDREDDERGARGGSRRPALSDQAAWHRDGDWRRCAGDGGCDAGIAPAGGPAGDGNAGRCAYLFVDAAMHGAIDARFTAPRGPSPAAWGLIARHYNDAHHLRLELRRDGDCLVVRLLRRAADADPEYRPRTLAEARSALPDGARTLRWQFNGTRHEAALDGERLLAAHDGFMGGVEIVGLFAEAGEACAVWHSWRMVSSQWVPRHVVRRAAYAAVVRPGNVHQLHLAAAPGRRPSHRDPRSNVFWESGLQVGHVGGSEIKFTQGAALDLLTRGAVADLVRWRGPMPRFVDQDRDLRGYAHGHAAFYDDRVVAADWAAVRVRRSVGPDFDLLARALTGAARFAAADTRTFTAWELADEGPMTTLRSGPCAGLYPAALVFPLRVRDADWHLMAAVGGLNHVGGDQPGQVFGWRCPRGLTASHDLRVAPTVPGVEYGFWIALSWLATADTHRAEAAALRLRDDFQSPALVTPTHGAVVAADAKREQPADLLTLAGCFDRGIGAYRLRAAAGRVRFVFDPGQGRRERPVLLVSGLGGGGADRAEAEASAYDAVACTVDDVPLAVSADFRWQPWPAPDGVLVQLRRTVTAPLTVEISSTAHAR